MEIVGYDLAGVCRENSGGKALATRAGADVYYSVALTGLQCLGTDRADLVLDEEISFGKSGKCPRVTRSENSDTDRGAPGGSGLYAILL